MAEHSKKIVSALNESGVLPFEVVWKPTLITNELIRREVNSKFNLANFMKVTLYTAFGALKTGLDILLKEEDVQIDSIFGHGGLFTTKGVFQKILAAAMNAPVSVMDTASEGGAWGMAILASYMNNKKDG